MDVCAPVTGGKSGFPTAAWSHGWFGLQLRKDVQIGFPVPASTVPGFAGRINQSYSFLSQLFGFSVVREIMPQMKALVNGWKRTTCSFCMRFLIEGWRAK